METVTLSEARVYVGTYNKYNSGSLFGYRKLDIIKRVVCKSLTYNTTLLIYF